MRLDGLHVAVYKKATESIVRLRQSYSIVTDAMEMPRLRFTLTGPTAGIAHLDKGWINFNDVLLKANPEYFINEIVPHEIAHFATDHMHPYADDHHGPVWKAIMATLGCQPNVYHEMDVTRVQRNTKPFACQQCGKEFALADKQYRMWDNGIDFKHKPCAAKLVPITVEGLAA